MAREEAVQCGGAAPGAPFGDALRGSAPRRTPPCPRARGWSYWRGAAAGCARAVPGYVRLGDAGELRIDGKDDPLRSQYYWYHGGVRFGRWPALGGLREAP